MFSTEKQTISHKNSSKFSKMKLKRDPFIWLGEHIPAKDYNYLRHYQIYYLTENLKHVFEPILSHLCFRFESVLTRSH